MSQTVAPISEPPTSGKVLLVTSIGDLDVELWCRECPRATKNFLGLCMRGYYDQCSFFRVIHDWLAQTGDHASDSANASVHDSGNNSDGGDSIYDHQPFKAEIHSRLKFSRRGMLGMATDSAGLSLSQFFITLSTASSLNGQHPCFGKVTNETIYNLARFRDIETDKRTDRPYNPPVILRAEVLINPFAEELTTMIASEKISSVSVSAKDHRKEAKYQKLSVRNAALLSFEDDDEIDLPALPIDASADAVDEGSQLNDQQVTGSADSEAFRPIRSLLSDSKASETTSSNVDDRKRARSSDSVKDGDGDDDDDDDRGEDFGLSDINHENEDKQQAKKARDQQNLQREIQSLASRLFGNSSEQAPKAPSQSGIDQPTVSPLEKIRAHYMQKKTPTDTLARLAQFKKKLHTPQPAPSDDGTNECKRDTSASESSWLHHRLTFARRPQDENELVEGDDFTVFDPLGVESTSVAHTTSATHAELKRQRSRSPYSDRGHARRLPDRSCSRDRDDFRERERRRHRR